MTEIQQYQPHTEVALANVQDIAVQRLGEWAQSAQAAYSVAERLVQTSFVPEGFRNKPHEATAAILSGLEVGLSPMAALRSFDVIQGTAAPRAITLRAILQSRGHEIEVVESTNTRCKMRGRRKGATDWQSVLWTIERAQQLGVTNKANWKNQPAAMLVARATSELSRLVAADAILGIGYSSEEIADGGDVERGVATVEPAQTGTRKMSRATKPVEPEPTAEPETAEAEAEIVTPSSPGSITDDQIKKLQTMYGKVGIKVRDEKLAYAVSIIDRPISSAKELSLQEASQVIEALTELEATAPGTNAEPDPTTESDWAGGQP